MKTPDSTITDRDHEKLSEAETHFFEEFFKAAKMVGLQSALNRPPVEPSSTIGEAEIKGELK